MKVFVDQDLCIGCGLCIDTVPEVFDWNNEERAEAIEEEVSSDYEDETTEAIENCPTDAIQEIE